MTTILAIETSSECASVALLYGNELISRALPGTGAAHSGNVLPGIHLLMADAQLGLASLDVIAFGRGPGAFTGVRLACGVAQGLALGVDRPVAAISSLEALALPAARAGSRLYCAMDARMNEAYIGRFLVVDGRLVADGEVVCVPPAEAPLPESDGWTGLGTAFAAYAGLWPQALAHQVSFPGVQATPLAEDVARLAAARPDCWLDAALAAPEYVRNRVALTTAERLAQGGRA
ncbi:tRNA (adenosine(37)-N6)-threonylcarbamoyltransferase complex dimerization subunit type 1 TsaB [Viridibacterium curvum]|uniref:tRNA (Adenosine(37)-N6)-threonylcarbamoyltransferase complex dimerization subunit type 1 TsaB n=1 Tax=Viridibacterium curvum TaxID=1101404 RepID=A0ABP9QGD7_9RHOO